MSARQEAIPPMLERFELKYAIPVEWMDPISDFAAIYCDPDKYCEKSPDRLYRINNLYLDSPNFLFLRNRLEGAEKRFNLRIRSYGDHPVPPFFFEIKYKQEQIVRKFRAAIHAAEWTRLFDPMDPIHDDASVTSDKERSSLGHFLRIVHTYNAEPKVLTQYKRRAYISTVDDYARVTFDMDFRYAPEPALTVIPDEGRMIPYDNAETFYPDVECSVILELKCHATRVPLWMLDLIRRFDLNRRSFSKYTKASMKVLTRLRYDPGVSRSVAGF